MQELKRRLESELVLEDPGLVGCRRRSVWTEESRSWRWVRSNALLALLGDKYCACTPAGDFEFFALSHTWLLQFRGGQWNDYWYEDFFDTWAIAHEFSELSESLSHTIIVLQENKGELTIHNIPVPEELNPIHRTQHILEQFNADPPGRIPKSGSRAAHICRYCPVKLQCDSTDKLRGETHDWTPSYPQP